MIVVWSPQAIGDVVRIIAYISAENPVAAARVARELLVAGDSLVEFPLRGRRSSQPGYREMSAVFPYVIVYRLIEADTVDILRVWHASQNRRGEPLG